VDSGFILEKIAIDLGATSPSFSHLLGDGLICFFIKSDVACFSIKLSCFLAFCWITLYT